MPKSSKPASYAVRKGRVPGVECEAQVKGFAASAYKKLSTEAEAREFMAARSTMTQNSLARDTVPSTSTSRSIMTSESKAVAKAYAGVEMNTEDERDCDIVYCDGACKGNGTAKSVAGLGVWWGHGDPRNLAERCPGDQTNNRAELIAIIRILETTPPLKRRLLIKTDSHYSIQCVTTWIFSWMRNGFITSDGKPVKNRAVIKYLAALLHVRRETGQKVEFKHVRGHVGIEGNEAADQLANLGATKDEVPERDWDRLEERVLRSQKPAAVEMADDELKAYVDGLSDGDEWAELPGLGTSRVEVPSQQSAGFPSKEGRGRNTMPSVLPVSREHVVPLVSKPTVRTAAMPSDKVTSSRSKGKMPDWSSSSDSFPPARLGSSTKDTVALSEEELKQDLVSCLLSKDEFNNLGKDGMFYSDF